jgi:uncharacterized membrane protein YfcA
MPELNLLHAAAAFLSAFLAGTVNSVAGGGTLISFPTLVWLGLSSVTANATNTVAIWPGTIGAISGYRRELRLAEPWVFILVVPSLAGGLVGAWLLTWTPPERFDQLAPFLVLFATLLFMAQKPIQERLHTVSAATRRSGRWLAGGMLFQFFVAVYGGYFGAGIGILMLAALGVLGLTEIHQMNGLKSLFGLCINGVAAIYFSWMNMVQWEYVILMAIGAITGGYLFAGLARRLGATAVRRMIVVIGFAMSLSLFLKR